MTRYAVYYAPAPGSALHDFGATWLGRDAATGHSVEQLNLPEIDLVQVTAAPRHYGFHATLKAPFRLAEGRTASELYAAVGRLAQSVRTVRSVRLVVRRIGAWLALVPDAQPPALTDLAFAVVRDLDPLRAVLSAEDRARRNPHSLTHRQRDLLDLWGYPYVEDLFKFHMTLAGPAEASVLDRLEPILTRAWAESAIGPIDVDAIAIFEQPEEGAPFIMRSRHGLTPLPRRKVRDSA